MEQVRLGRVRVHEHGAAQRLGGAPAHHRGRQAVEHRLAGMQPHRPLAVRRPVHRQPAARRLGVRLQRRQQGIGGPGPARRQRERPLRVAFDPQVEQRRGLRHEAAHVARQQPAVVFALRFPGQLGQPPAHLAAVSVQRPLALRQRPHLLPGEPPLQPRGGAGVILRNRLHQKVAHRHPLEQPPDHVEHLVGAELPADRLQLVEQRPHHPPLARAAGHQIDDHHRIVRLPVAMDAAHALLQPRRVPGNVVVHHQPAELQVDALAGGVGGHQVVGAALRRRAAKERHLPVALPVGQAAVDQRDAPREAQAFQPPHQELRGVAVLGEDDQLLAAEPGVAQHLPQRVELGLVARRQPGARVAEERGHLEPLRLQLAQVHRHGGAQRPLLEPFVALGAARPGRGVLVGGAGLELVVQTVQAPLPARELLFRETSLPNLRDQRRQLLVAALERARQRVGGAGEPPLEDAHRQPRRRPVEDPRAVVVVADVVGGRVVQLLLAPRSLRQGVAERVATALRVEWRAVEADHLLLGAAQEVVAARLRREAVERGGGGQRVGQQQAPQEVGRDRPCPCAAWP